MFGKQIGTSASEVATSVATDDDGNFYLAGDTSGNLFSGKDSNGSDAWVAKYDSSGNLIWGKQFGSTLTGGDFSNTAFGLDVNEGDVYVSGLSVKENQNRDIFDFNVEDDSWVVKFDSNGNQQWYTEFDTFFFNESYDLAVDDSGNSYLVGWTQGLVKESDPSRDLLKYDAWIAKVDPGGQTEWIQQLGSVNDGLEFAWGVDTDSQGNIYATGWTTGDLGIPESDKQASYDIWLSKFTPDGTQQWVKQIGSKGDDGTFYADLEIDSQDNIFLTGYSNEKIKDKQGEIGNYDAFVAKFDTKGNNQWTQEFGSKEDLEYATGVTANGGDRLYVTGFTEAFLGSNGSGANGSAIDAWVAVLDREKGKLQEFVGETEGEIKGDLPGPSVEDITNEFVTD